MTSANGPASVDGGLGGDPRHDPRYIRAKALDRLLKIVEQECPLDEDGEPIVRGFEATQVTAASRLLSHSEWAEEREAKPVEQLVELLGSPEQALVWLEQLRPKLLRLVSSKQRGLIDGQRETADPRSSTEPAGDSPGPRTTPRGELRT